MKCPNCRAVVPKQYKFCPKCGLSVKAARQSGRYRFNLFVICLLGVIVISGGVIARTLLKHHQPKPQSFFTAESSESEQKESVTTLPAVTTAAETTEPPAESEPSEEQTDVQTTMETQQTTPAATPAPETEPAPQEDGNTPADYYKTLGAMPFHEYDSGDPFLPTGLYTRADNRDGSALKEADAKNAMMKLGVDWGKNADLYCGDTPDESGMSNSTYRYIADAFPVPGYSDLQLPAAVDLYIHNGDAAQGSYLRAVDYRFCNHDDYTGKYVWDQAEIAKIFAGIAEYADGVYGGHTEIADSNLVHYNYRDGALSIGYYEQSGKYVLWISRAND